MAKSKLVKANKKIEEKVVGSFKKIEQRVTKGYESMENTFVDQFLTKDDESIEDAKLRLKREQNQRELESERKGC